MKKFIPFWLDTNQIFKMIKTEEDFNQARDILALVDKDIFKCRNTKVKEATPNFGFKREHQGELTLGAWLSLRDSNG